MPPPSIEPADRPSPIPWPPILLGAGIIASIALGYVAPLGWPGTDDFAARTITIVPPDEVEEGNGVV